MLIVYCLISIANCFMLSFMLLFDMNCLLFDVDCLLFDIDCLLLDVNC